MGKINNETENSDISTAQSTHSTKHIIVRPITRKSSFNHTKLKIVLWSRRLFSMWLLHIETHKHDDTHTLKKSCGELQMLLYLSHSPSIYFSLSSTQNRFNKKNWTRNSANDRPIDGSKKERKGADDKDRERETKSRYDSMLSLWLLLVLLLMFDCYFSGHKI